MSGRCDARLEVPHSISLLPSELEFYMPVWRVCDPRRRENCTCNVPLQGTDSLCRICDTKEFDRRGSAVPAPRNRFPTRRRSRLGDAREPAMSRARDARHRPACPPSGTCGPPTRRNRGPRVRPGAAASARPSRARPWRRERLRAWAACSPSRRSPDGRPRASAPPSRACGGRPDRTAGTCAGPPAPRSAMGPGGRRAGSSGGSGKARQWPLDGPVRTIASAKRMGAAAPRE